MSLGERIRAVRLSKGITIQEVANKLGVTYQNISQYERDIRNPKLATLQKIAAALNVNVWEIIQPENTAPSTFSERLTTIISLRPLTCEQIADAIEVDPDDIDRMMAGDLEPTHEQFKALALFLNVTEDCLEGKTEAVIVERGAESDEDAWTLGEHERRDPDRQLLFHVAQLGSITDVRQASAVVRALQETVPGFYKNGG